MRWEDEKGGCLLQRESASFEEVANVMVKEFLGEEIQTTTCISTMRRFKD